MCNQSQNAASRPILIVPPMAPGVARSADCQVAVNGRPVPVHEISVKDGKAPMVSFDFCGTAAVEVTFTHPVGSAEVRPRSFGIPVTIRGNTVCFELNEPRKVVVEINGRRKGAVHFFANPPEVDPPRAGSGNVRYFALGVHEAGIIRLESNTTVYLAAGAYVYGTVRAEGAHDIKVMGRGILDGSKAVRTNLINIIGCTNVELRDLILLDCQSWVCHIHSCSRNVLIDNLKIVNLHRGGTDGIDIVSTQDIRVHDCFIRDCDDNIVTKAFTEGPRGDVRNVRVSKCVLWSDGCRALQNGVETRSDKIEDVVFQDIDIIHHLDLSHPVLSIVGGDRAMIRNIRFEDIRIEDAAGSPLIDLWTGKSYYSKQSERGHVQGVHFKNVTLTGGPAPRIVTSWAPHADGRLLGIYGFDSEHAVEDVTIENLHIGGRYIDRPEQANILIRDFARNIRFVPPLDGSPAASFVTEPATPPGVGQTVRFDASGSVGQDSKIASYEWGFGDGSTANGCTAEHAYARSGHYAVILRVRDEAGRVGRIDTVVSVFTLHQPDAVQNLTRGGLNYVCYEGAFNPRGDENEFASATAVKTGTTECPDEAALCEHGKQWTACLSGYIDVPQSGVYLFYLEGVPSRLLIGDSTVAEAALILRTYTDWGQIGLERGKHAFRLWSDAERLRELKVEWEGPGVPLQVVFPNVLYRA